MMMLDRSLLVLLLLWTLSNGVAASWAEEGEAVAEVDEGTGRMVLEATNHQQQQALCWNYTAAERTRVRERLYSDLFGNYNRHVRPESERSTTTVSVDLGVVSVSELNNLEGTFVLDSWYRLYWNDARLAWNPDDYCGLTGTTVPSDTDTVWVPDIYMWVLSDEPTITTWEKTFFNVYSDGSVTISNGRKDKIKCELDLQNFPRDTQACKFTAGSWAHSSSDIQTLPYGDTSLPGGYERLESQRDNPKYAPGLDMDAFRQKDTHNVERIKVETIQAKYALSDDPWTQVDYTFYINREPYTYISTVGWPMLIVAFLATLTPMFHPLAPGKSIAAVTLLLTLTAVYITASNYVPKISYATTLSKLYTVCLMFVLTSVMEAGLSVYLVTFARDGRHGYLQWHIPLMTRFVDILFWYVRVGGMSRRRKIRRWYNQQRTKGTITTGKQNEASECSSVGADKTDLDDVELAVNDSMRNPEQGNRSVLFMQNDNKASDFGRQPASVEISSDVEQDLHLELEDSPQSQGRKKSSVRFSRIENPETSIDEKSDFFPEDANKDEISIDGGQHPLPPKQINCRNLMNRESYSSRVAACSYNPSCSERTAASNPEQLMKASKRRETTKMPKYVKLLLVDDSGHYFLEDTWEKLIEIYEGKADSHTISKADLLTAIRFFFLEMAIFIDQLSAIVLPIALLVSVILISRKYGIDWTLRNPSTSEFSLPTVEFIPASQNNII